MGLANLSNPLGGSGGSGSGGGGSGTISSGTTNTLPKYTAATTVGNSLLSDDGTTLTYTGAGGIAAAPGSGAAGALILTQGTAPTAGTTNLTLYVGTSVTSFIRKLPSAAATGLYLGTNTAGVVVDTQVAAPTGTIVGTTDTQTLTNKRNSARITTITSSATPTVNTDNCDCVTITAQAAAITSMTTNLSGTPVNFDQLEYRILDNGTARAITWGASFAAGPTALPTTTVLSKALHVFFEWDSVQTKWVCLSSGSDA